MRNGFCRFRGGDRGRIGALLAALFFGALAMIELSIPKLPRVSLAIWIVLILGMTAIYITALRMVPRRADRNSCNG